MTTVITPPLHFLGNRATAPGTQLDARYRWGSACGIYAVVVQYSASGQSFDTILRTLRVGVGTVAMIALAWSTSRSLARGCTEFKTRVAGGRCHWLRRQGAALADVGLIRFQPSRS
jgi:hypothetical protein